MRGRLEPSLPPGYRLQRDPDPLLLLGPDGKIVGRLLFWSRVLQEVTSAHPHWWRSLLEGIPVR